jgi:flavodoxin
MAKAKQKTKILIVYDSNPKELQDAAKQVKGVLDPETFSVKVRIASEAKISEILAADAYFFGTGTGGSPDYAEIERLLKGISLVGRPCGFFTLGKPNGATYLRRICADAELLQNKVSFAFKDGMDPEAVREWAIATVR